MTLSYQDLLGHTEATASATGVILDNAPPTLSVSEDVSVIATGANGAVITYPPATASDAVTANPVITYSRASGTEFPLGVTVVTVTATDGIGNAAAKVFKVTVQPSADANLASVGVQGLALVPAFDPATTLYRNTVGYATATATLTALPSFSAARVTLASNVNLIVGENHIPIVVTAQDGNTKTYTVVIRRLPADFVQPFVNITTPSSRVTDDLFTAAGSVNESIGLASLIVTLNGGSPVYVPISTEAGGAIPWSLGGLVPENGKNTLVVTATDYAGNSGTASKTFDYTTSKFAGMAGVYNAVLVPTGTPDAKAIGLVTVTVSKTGTFTMKVQQPGITGTGKGILHNDGTAFFQINKTLFPVAQPGAVGEMTFNVQPDVGLVGTVGAATFAGKIAPFGSKNPVPATPYLNQPAGSANPPTKGVYNLVVQPVNPTAGMPPGEGYASATISKTGSVKVAGYLADGTRLSAATKLRADGTAPVFAQLYGKRGGFGTDLVFTSRNDTDVLGENSTWIRPVGKPGDRAFPSGWPSGVEIDIFGTQWNGAASMDLGQPDPSPTVGNAVLAFEDGALATSIEHSISLHPVTGKVNVVPSNGTPCKLSVNPATGIFSGTFAHTDETKPKFGGILINKGANRGGHGYFLSKPTLSAPSQGGRVVIELNSVAELLQPR